MIIQVNNKTNTLVLVILRYANLCIFVSSDLVTPAKHNLCKFTHSAVLGFNSLGQHFCATLLF